MKPPGKRDSASVWLVLAVIFSLVGTATAQNTAIAYQGRLKLGGGIPTSDSFFDLRFRLFSAATGGSQSGEVFVPSIGTDSNGLFTAMVDFGVAAFSPSESRYIELGARRSGSPDDYTPMLPRQQVVPVPTALRAQQADVAGSYTGSVALAQLPESVARLDVPQTFTAPPAFMPPTGVPFTVGMTTTVHNLSADLLDGLNWTAFWRRETNDGVSSIIEPEDRPFEIRVQNTPAFRLQKGDSNLGWSLIGGSANNTIAAGVPGSVIGGGRGNLIETGAHYSSVLGGDGNRIGQNSRDSVVGGGTRNRIGNDSAYSGIFAGYGGVVSSNSRFAGVLLGNYGTVRENSDFAAVISGDENSVGPGGGYSVILSGRGNRVESGATYSVLAGLGNTVGTNAFCSVLPGGQYNKVEARTAVLGGGSGNVIGYEAYGSVLAGGWGNRIEWAANHAVLAGGQGNLVRTGAAWSAVLGGVGSVAGAPFAIAAGHNAMAEHSGSILLADGQYSSFLSSNVNEFAVRAGGGVRFVTGGAGLTVDGMKLTGGAGGIVVPAGSVAASNLVDGAVLAEIADDDGTGSGLDADRLDGFSSEDFWRLTGNIGTTAGVNFLGTTDNEPLDLKVSNRRGLRIQPDAGFLCGGSDPPVFVMSPNLIGGFAGNTIALTNAGSVIAGGGASTVPCVGGPPQPNAITADFANISGGQNNVVEGDHSGIGSGIGHRIWPRATASVIGGGSANQIAASATAATIAGGRNNYVATSAGSTVGGGHGNRVESQFATVPGGAEARASLYGQTAHASGSFAAAGDAQTSQYVLRGVTSDASPRELFLNGDSERLRLPDDSVWTFDILVVARSDGASGAGYRITGVIKHNTLGLTVFIGTPTVTTLGEQVAGWDVAAEADDANDALVIKVMGASGATVRWVANVRTAEVIF